MRSGVVVAAKYRLVRELGSGGMGSVWQATHVVTERDFAIKFLQANCAADPTLLARFFQEARVSGKLRHPSIIEIFDVGTSPELGGVPFLVMELLDGASLDVLVRKLGRLPPRTVLETVAEAARAIALAHDKGIVHRDLKPANLFLHRPGTGALVPKVLDFGISKIAGNTPEPAGGITTTGTVLGSPLYMSPEQAASDKSIDGRSDVHALGVVIWECLVGQPPFVADTYNNLVVQIITGGRPRLEEVWPGALPGLADLVARAMARQREDRFQSAAELADALEAQLATMPPSTSLSSRTAAAELFARVHPSVRPPTPAGPGGSTTGGMAVPSTRDVPVGRSPAAVTMEARSRLSSSAAFAETRPADRVGPAGGTLPATLAATVNEPALPAAPVPAVTAPTKTRMPARQPPGWVLGAAALGGLLTLAGAVALVVGLRHRTPGATPSLSADPASPAATVPTVTAPPVAAPPVVATSAPAATAPVPSPPASASAAAPAMTNRPATTAALSPSPLVTATPHTAPPNQGAKRPKDSVESSGF
jgi:serine/threonine-protein kinase